MSSAEAVAVGADVVVEAAAEEAPGDNNDGCYNSVHDDDSDYAAVAVGIVARPPYRSVA